MLCCACLQGHATCSLAISHAPIATTVAMLSLSSVVPGKPGRAAGGSAVPTACQPNTACYSRVLVSDRLLRWRQPLALAPTRATISVSDAALLAVPSACTASDQARPALQLLLNCSMLSAAYSRALLALLCVHTGTAGARHISSAGPADEPGGCAARQWPQRHHILAQGVIRRRGVWHQLLHGIAAL